MAKPRVHELAKELGITSKEAISTLQTLGEFVRGASSTVEPPVAKKLRSAFADKADKAAAAPARPAGGNAPSPAKSGRPAPRPGTSAKPGSAAPSPGPAAAKPAEKPAAKPAQQDSAQQPAARAEQPSAPERPAAQRPASPGAKAPSPGPRPGNNPFATQQGMSRGGAPRDRKSVV